jgi:hypothetical protein
MATNGKKLSAEDHETRGLMREPETIQLIRFYYAISDPRERSQFLELVKSIAADTR